MLIGGGNKGYIIECINNGNIVADSGSSGGIVGIMTMKESSTRGYICNCYNTGTVAAGGGSKAIGGIVGEMLLQGGSSYIYNCYNSGNTNGGGVIVGYNHGAGKLVSLNNYASTDATVEKLNVESEIDQALKDTNLYRSNAWVLKDGKIALSWE